MLDENDSQGGPEEEEEEEEEDSEEPKDTEQGKEVAPEKEDADEDLETAPDGDEDDPESETPDFTELDDDTLAAFFDVYGEKFTESETVQKLVDERVERQAQKSIEDSRRGQQRTSEVEQIIQKGKDSVQEVAESIKVAESAYTKLRSQAKSEELDELGPEILFDPQKLGTAIQGYGTAMSAEATLRYERALDGAFGGILADVAPDGLTPKETEKLETIVNNATRMRGDTAQSQDEAVGYFLKEVMQFVATKATEKGAALEKSKAAKRRKVGEAIAGSNAVKAAKAKLAKERLAPGSPKGKDTAGVGATLIEQYRQAKKEKNYDRLGEIEEEMIQARRGGAYVT